MADYDGEVEVHEERRSGEERRVSQRSMVQASVDAERNREVYRPLTREGYNRVRDVQEAGGNVVDAIRRETGPLPPPARVMTASGRIDGIDTARGITSSHVGEVASNEEIAAVLRRHPHLSFDQAVEVVIEGRGRTPLVEALGEHEEAVRSRAVGSEREGWRARLAHIELLLREALTNDDQNGVSEALDEVRAMIDGVQPRDAGTQPCQREPGSTCHSPDYCDAHGCQL